MYREQTNALSENCILHEIFNNEVTLTPWDIFIWKSCAYIFHLTLLFTFVRKYYLFGELSITVTFISYKSLKQINPPVALDSNNPNLDGPIGKTKDLISLKGIKLVVH